MFFFFFLKETLHTIMCFFICVSFTLQWNFFPPLCVCRYSPVQRATVSSAWNVIFSSTTLSTAAPAAFTVKVHPNFTRPINKAGTFVNFFLSLHCWCNYLYSSVFYHMAGIINFLNKAVYLYSAKTLMSFMKYVSILVLLFFRWNRFYLSRKKKQIRGTGSREQVECY